MAPTAKIAAPLPRKTVLLKVIDPTHENSTVLVCVINKWRVFDNKGSKLPMSVELVLMDVEGARIHAHINRPYIYKLDKHITEGSVYYVTKFGIGPSLGEYRPARHEYKLNFNLGTKIPVMLMRNIDQAAGLCNGTRLMVDHLGKSVISATVLTGKNVGDKVFIPRMNLIPSDPGLPVKFKRRQFPLTVCFAMTINKSQGQTSE